MNRLVFRWAALLVLMVSITARSSASDDHDHDQGHAHDHGDAPAANASAAPPRFAVASERFELVGIADGRRLMVYLDRFADNSPVEGAQLELKVGGTQIAVHEHAPGEFEATLAQPLAAGATAVAATVVAGAHRELLSAEFDVHEETHREPQPRAGWRRLVAWLGASAAAAGVLLWVVCRNALRRSNATRGAA